MVRPTRCASCSIRSARRRATAGSCSSSDGLGQQTERADRRLQLVADVGDEVAAHGLEPAALGDVVDDDDGADGAPLVVERVAGEHERPPGRAEQVEGAAVADARRGRRRAAPRWRRRRAPRRGGPT